MMVKAIRTDTRLLHHGTPSGGDTTTEEADLLQRCFFIDSDDRDVCDNGVLREGGSAHLRFFVSIYVRDILVQTTYEVIQRLALASEAASTVGHDTLTLGGAD